MYAQMTRCMNITFLVHATLYPIPFEIKDQPVRITSFMCTKNIGWVKEWGQSPRIFGSPSQGLCPKGLSA